MRETLTIQPGDLRLGDTIIDGKSGTEVNDLDRFQCRTGVHVNGRACYDRIATLTITREVP